MLIPQYGSYQRCSLADDLNRKWKQIILHTAPVTPLEHCEGLNKLLMVLWPNYINPKLCMRFSSIVEERIELQEFSLGSRPPVLGLNGGEGTRKNYFHTSTGLDYALRKRVMRLGFDWDSTDVNILLFAKLAKPLVGTARIVINSIHITGEVMYKTQNPQWHQTLEFPDDGSPLVLHVKDHSAVLPESCIADCIVEYQRMPLNQTAEKWIPLQGVRRGEIHIQITRKVPGLEKRPSLDSESSTTKAHQISGQMKEMMLKFKSLIEDGDGDGLSTFLSELESLHDMQDEYVVQLETEKMLLLSKIDELSQEIFNSTPTLSRGSSNN